MKREIKFRGKIASENLEELISCELEIPNKDGWVVGSFVEPNIITGNVVDIDWEYFATEWWAKVIPETIGQFTGLKDKNGVEIYEGDKFRYRKRYGYILPAFTGEILFRDGCFGYMKTSENIGKVFYSFSEFDELQEDFLDHIEIIGNIHDNPELLKLETL